MRREKKMRREIEERDEEISKRAEGEMSYQVGPDNLLFERSEFMCRERSEFMCRGRRTNRSLLILNFIKAGKRFGSISVVLKYNNGIR